MFAILGGISGIWVIYWFINQIIKKLLLDRREVINEINKLLSKHEEDLKNIDDKLQKELKKMEVVK